MHNNNDEDDDEYYYYYYTETRNTVFKYATAFSRFQQTSINCKTTKLT